MELVGLIGLGLMGSALAERFRAGGLRVIGFDVREECRNRLAELGGEPVSSARAVFEAARTVVLSLPNSDVVAAVIGEVKEILSGATIIDTTTGHPDATAKLGQTLNELGADYLDATLTGSSSEARAGKVVVTAGGPVDVFARAELLFAHFASRWFHVGPWGSGARTKLVVNLVLGLNRTVFAEGLAFARRCGLDLNAILEILRSGAAYSRVMDTKGRKMIEEDFATEAKLAQHLKDVRLVLDTGGNVGAKLPMSQLHEKLLSDLAARGFGDLDNSCIIRAFGGEGGAP